MANSMTGFGRGEASGHGYQFTVELKSVNHRFFEASIRVPRNMMSFEERIRKLLQEKIQRGRLDVYVNVKETEEKKRLVKVDKDLALSYDKTLKELAFSLEAPYETDIYRLTALPEVLAVEDEELDLELLWETLHGAVSDALNVFLEMRQIEGKKLAEDLLKRLEVILTEKDQISSFAESMVPDYQGRLRERIQLLLGENSVLDEARLANEVAVFADRVSITEELVRLQSHLDQGRQTLQSPEKVGRKLDFLVQEMNREINTIGSKANNLSIAQLVVEVKSELEKIREQVQNLE
ncbi:YicC/YloC family endoribonuclease [Desulfitobacterium sp.]|uniref:YicC/YloC family endoribonuclease n=1 Tax=Desulfitobacterium sp. TaxID=49981 RepID=UPI002CA266AA|nr:YicC/YloC family endoribonuclease [Desulfitobacterium sp.]HVJ50530.1 YicC/YloC family endoribonuclease [Desulfitobacterium sp.]